MKKPVMDDLEKSELIKLLTDNGYGDLVNALLNDGELTYTKKGRLNKSSTCRFLGWKGKQLEDAIQACKELLSKDFALK